jgi:cytoskeletal protein CcmA (bactofilin family)
MNKIKNGSFLSIVASAVALTLLLAGGAGATIIQTSDDIHISNLHHIDDDFYAFGQTITVDGLIEGDLVAGGYEVFTNGDVTGSQNVFAYRLHHTGTIGNSLRAFVNTAEIDGRVGRSIVIFAYDTRIGKGAIIERDVTIGGYSAHLEGTVGGKATVRADRIYISGEIRGDVDIEGRHITISPPTVIKGNLTYTSEKEIEIDPASGVTVLGETKWKKPERKDEEKEKGALSLRSVVLEISKLLAAFLFGIIVIYVFKRYAQESFNQLRTRFAVSAAVGFLALLIVIASVIILLISVVLIIIGLALISGNLAPVGAMVLILSILTVPIASFVTVSGGIVFYSGMILFALLLGYLAVKIFKAEPAMLGKGQLLLGLIVLAVLFAIPYVGFPIYLLITIIGAGGIILGIKNCRPATEQSSSSNMSPAGRQQ